MSKKKYKIDGKYYDFNNKKFKEIVKKFSAKNNKSKRRIFIDFVEYCGLHFDSYKTIEKWESRDVGPKDKTFFKSIVEFFKVDPEDFLDEVKDYNKNKIEGAKEMYYKKFGSNDTKLEQTNIKKFNSVQISEFIRIKDCILNYLYTYYSSYMTDIDVFAPEDDKCTPILQIVRRLYDTKDYIKANKCFSKEEMEEIKKAIEIQETYEEIEDKRQQHSFKHLFTPSKYDEILTDQEKNFLRENEKRMNLLYVYEGIKKIGYKLLLREEVDKTLSILPYEVYKKLIQLIEIIPSPYWEDEYDSAFDDETNYNIDEVILIDEYEDDLKRNRIIKSKMEGGDKNNGMLLSSISRTEEIQEAKNTLMEVEKKDYDQIVYSINNRVMNVHRILNDIMKKYID